MNKKQKRHSHRGYMLVWLIVFLAVGVLVMFLFTLAGKDTIQEIILSEEYWLSVGVLDGLFIIAFLLMYRVDAQNIALKENDLEDTAWLTVKKLRKMKEFTVASWKEIPAHQDRIVIGAKKKGTSIEIISTSQLHALIVGTTGSGKTTGFVDQNIAILARSKTKPSIVITDPKKELYEKHAKNLEKEGYRLSVLDLREPYASARWNPMNVLIRRIRMVKELENHLQNQDGKYYGAGETFLSYQDARARVQELKDEIYENARDLIYTLCPVQNKDQPTWEEGARNLILGLLLAFCEDCIKGKVEEKQLLLFNLYHNITTYCSEDTTVLKQYLLENRDAFSKVRGLVNTVLITSDKTLTSYLSEVNSYMQQLSDDGILCLTSENDLNIATLDEEANAVFIIVPDERFTRHRFVTLFITQMYKELVEKANLNLRRNQTETAILKRNTYFVLDEFANLPKFEHIEGMVTVARSRGIRFLFVLQSFSQLVAKYGHEIGDIIKTNCNVKIFIGSDDYETRKAFSELCGQKKIKHVSINTNAETSASSNTGASNQPLITTGMLERLNGNEKGDAIVSVRGYEPIWTKFTPSYDLKHFYFQAGKIEDKKQEARLFEKQAYVFDIHHPNGESEEERILDAIEEQDRLLSQTQQENTQILATLDRKWEEVVADIRKRVDVLCLLLHRQDAETLKSAKLEEKANVILMLSETYDQSTAQKMQDVSEYLLDEALPELDRLQNEASKYKGG